MKSQIRTDPRLATVLAMALAFAAAASLLFLQMLGLMSGQLDLARFIMVIPVLGFGAVGALTWWVIFPRWQEMRRVQTLVKDVTGVGRAELDLEKSRVWKNSKRLRYAWIAGIAAAVVLATLSRSNWEDAPLWVPLAMITVAAQLNFQQTVEERVRALIVCGVLLFIFAGAGRHVLGTWQGAFVLVVSLFALIGWHFWQQRRGVVEMQSLVREARYEQAIAKAELSPSNFAPALKAYAQFRQGDAEDAKFGLRVALAKAVDSSKAAFALAKYGELLLAEGQIEGALAPVAGALRLRPEETRAHRVMAQIFLQQIDILRQGYSRRQSDIAQQERVLAQARARQDQTGQPRVPDGTEALIEAALGHAEKAAETKPQRGAELAVLAWAQAAAGQKDQAQQTAERAAQAITDQLDVAEGRYFLGRAYVMMGQLDASRSCFEAVKGAESKGQYRRLAERALADLAAKSASTETLTPDNSPEPSSITALHALNEAASPVESPAGEREHR